jgi:hypothetical protein
VDSIRLRCAYQFCFKVRKGLRLKHNCCRKDLEEFIGHSDFQVNLVPSIRPPFGSLVVRQTKQGVGWLKVVRWIAWVFGFAAVLLEWR